MQYAVCTICTFNVLSVHLNSKNCTLPFVVLVVIVVWWVSWAQQRMGRGGDCSVVGEESWAQQRMGRGGDCSVVGVLGTAEDG